MYHILWCLNNLNTGVALEIIYYKNNDNSPVRRLTDYIVTTKKKIQWAMTTVAWHFALTLTLHVHSTMRLQVLTQNVVCYK